LKRIKYSATKPDGCGWQNVYVVLFYASYSIRKAVLAARNNLLNTPWGFLHLFATVAATGLWTKINSNPTWNVKSQLPFY
jgi:hypothetical protein